MEKILSRSVAGFATLAILAALFASSAGAQARQGGKREQKHEPRHETFRTPHWAFDDRFHHNHYYPQRGYTVRVLPPSRLLLRFRGEPYFFHAGVWYRQVGPSFVVVRPPIGIVVPFLPPAYSTVVVAGVPYYYANEVYYVQQSDGYVVIAPPQEMIEQSTPPVPPPQGTAPGATGESSAGIWYYCDSAKAYYPYVSDCKEGWRAVPATPPQVR